MKRNTKKGFTLVELVIVIAVIAILAAVLIPTFSGIITKADNSADLQEARNTFSAALIDDYTLTDKDAVVYVVVGKDANEYVKFEGGKPQPVAVNSDDYTIDATGITVVAETNCTETGHKHDNNCGSLATIKIGEITYTALAKGSKVYKVKPAA